MTAPPPAHDAAAIAEIAKGLTKAQRAMVVESEPGGWGRDDEATGAEVVGAGPWSTARSLVAQGLGDIEEDPGSYPPALYFHNATGLAVRAHISQAKGE